MPEDIPKALAQKFATIATRCDVFCVEHVNEEYRQVVHQVVSPLARKPPSPLLRGKNSICASAAVHAVGRIYSLDDPALQRLAFENGPILHIPAERETAA